MPGSPRDIIAQNARTTLLMGVDVIPQQVHTEAASQAAPSAPKSSKPEPSASAPSGESADRLDALRARYEREAPHDSFGFQFQNIVFGEGDPNARLMFIGEAPGADEDASGRPFVGRAGQLLEKMIVAMGLARELVYIANVLKVRPTNNATPTTDQREASWPYLREQIEIIAPEVIVTLGLPATHTVLSTEGPMARLRAQFHTYECTSGREIPVMPTYHPAYLLRSYTPENRAKVWDDLKQVVTRLSGE